MSQLLCPRCEDGGNLEWENPDDPNLLESGIIKCGCCRSRYQGIPGWQRATKKEAEKHRISGPNPFYCSSVFCNDHPHGSVTKQNGWWILKDCEDKTVGRGRDILDAFKRYVHRVYGNPVKRVIPFPDRRG